MFERLYGQPGISSDVTVIGGIRRVDDIGPKGGSRRRFQVWIERRDNRRWDPRGTYVQHWYGETFARQWEAVQHARFNAEQCRALECAFERLSDTDEAALNNNDKPHRPITCAFCGSRVHDGKDCHSRP